MIGFIADEHIPLATIGVLRDAGFRVLSIREEYPSIQDDLILELAERERLVIITNDKDFSDLVYREKLPFKAGLIFCRLDRVLPNEIGDIILYHIKEYGAEFEHRFTVISKGKFRQRDL